MAVLGGVLVGVSGILLVLFFLFRMVAKSGQDWGFSYNLWERSTEKQQENENRGMAQQQAFFVFFQKLLPLTALIFFAGIVLIVIAAS